MANTLFAGVVVLVEDLTYTGALSVLASLDARVVGVPGDEEGIRTDLLGRALERHRPRLLYVQPTFHNPTARVMGEARRRELLNESLGHLDRQLELVGAGAHRVVDVHHLQTGQVVECLQRHSRQRIGVGGVNSSHRGQLGGAPTAAPIAHDNQKEHHDDDDDAQRDQQNHGS